MIKKDEKTFLGINLSDDPDRAKYIARIFAPFYEKLLGVWLTTKGFKLEGRPTIYDENGKRRTYDYTLRKNGKFYIVEAKCWLAFNNSEYLELKESLLSEWGVKDNFMFFCNLGTKGEPYKNYKFSYTDSNNDFKPKRKILIWSKVRKSEVEKIRERYKFSYIFSIEDAINDMVKEVKKGSAKGRDYSAWVLKYKKWADKLFNRLLRG